MEFGSFQYRDGRETTLGNATLDDRVRVTKCFFTFCFFFLPLLHNNHFVLAEEEEICWTRPKRRPVQAWPRQHEWVRQWQMEMCVKES